MRLQSLVGLVGAFAIVEVQEVLLSAFWALEFWVLCLPCNVMPELQTKTLGFRIMSKFLTG